MKFLLTLYVCSVVANQCGEIVQDKYSYQTIYDTHSSCVKSGLEQSSEVLFGGKLFTEDDINQFKFYPKYSCIPFESQDLPEEPELQS